MKFNLFNLICIFLYLFSMSCGTPDDPQQENGEIMKIDSFESAIPHGTPLPASEMSYQDKLKLAKAIGKKAFLITIDSLKSMIESDSSGWCLYSFWNLDCENCMEINQSLNQIGNLPEIESKLKMRYINTINLYPNQVNEYIRENGIVGEVFTMPTDTLDNWMSQIDAFWNGELPALLLINNTDGSRLFYQQEFSKEELQAILQTLTL